MKQTSILLADDHVMLLDALVAMLGQEFVVAGVARDGSAAVEMAKRLRPDVVVMDVLMPQLGGLEAARMLAAEPEPVRIIFLTMYDDLPLVEEAFKSGASGYVLKSGGVEELVKAIHTVARGGRYVTPLLADLVPTLLGAGPQQKHHATLTARQVEVLRLIAEGRTMREIGELLNITTRTAESHKYEIMRNLGLKTTAQLIRYAVRIHLVQSELPVAVPPAA